MVRYLLGLCLLLPCVLAQSNTTSTVTVETATGRVLSLPPADAPDLDTALTKLCSYYGEQSLQVASDNELQDVSDALLFIFSGNEKILIYTDDDYTPSNEKNCETNPDILGLCIWRRSDAEGPDNEDSTNTATYIYGVVCEAIGYLCEGTQTTCVKWIAGCPVYGECSTDRYDINITVDYVYEYIDSLAQNNSSINGTDSQQADQYVYTYDYELSSSCYYEAPIARMITTNALDNRHYSIYVFCYLTTACLYGENNQQKDFWINPTAVLYHFYQNNTDSIPKTRTIGKIRAGSVLEAALVQCSYSSEGIQSRKSSPASKAEISSSLRSVPLGNSVQLFCLDQVVANISKNFTVFYYWKTPDGTISKTWQDYFFVEDFQPEDQGYYNCTATMDSVASVWSDSIELRLDFSDPFLIQYWEETDEGTSVKLFCSSDDIGTIVKKYQFFKDGSAIDQEAEYASYWISPFSHTDEGDYTCNVVIGETVFKSSNTLDLHLMPSETSTQHPEVPNLFTVGTVLQPHDSNMSTAATILEEENTTVSSQEPDITLALPNIPIQAIVNLRDGESTTMTCQAPIIDNGNHDDSIIYNLMHIGGYMNIFLAPSLCSSQSSPYFEISSFSEESVGIYWCETTPVSNTIGIRSGGNNDYSQKLVLRRIYASLQSMGTTIPMKHNVGLSCIVHNSPYSVESYIWYREDRPEPLVTTESSKILLKNFQPYHEGNYSCEAIFAEVNSPPLRSKTVTLISAELYTTCACVCSNKSVNISYRKEEIENTVETIKEKLQVLKTNLSLSVRRYVSASDPRLSATSAGVVSVVVLTLTLAAIVVPDLLQGLAWFRYKLKPVERERIDMV